MAVTHPPHRLFGVGLVGWLRSTDLAANPAPAEREVKIA
jgi:hypothetical protein